MKLQRNKQKTPYVSPIVFLTGGYLMKLKVILTITAVYTAIIGIGHLFAPVAMSAGVVPADASAGMVAFLRHYSSLFIAMAVMNWIARNSEASTARNAIVTMNIVALGLASILDIFAVISGVGIFGLVPATMNLAFAIAFFWIARLKPATFSNSTIQ
jgi:hypothetical protein